MNKLVIDLTIKEHSKKVFWGAILIFTLWEVMPLAFHVNRNMLPPFHIVVLTIFNPKHFPLIVKHVSFTAIEALAGFTIGFLVSLFLAIIMEEFRIIDNFLLYPLIAFQNIPKVALAPLIILWSSYGITPKIVMASLVSFFPMFEGARIGLREDTSSLRRTLRVMGPTSSQIFFRIKLPEAVPSILTSAKVGMTYALIGAIVGEIVQPSSGLGFLIAQTKSDFQTNLQFASILVVSILGFFLYNIISLIGASQFIAKYRRHIDIQ